MQTPRMKMVIFDARIQVHEEVPDVLPFLWPSFQPLNCILENSTRAEYSTACAGWKSNYFWNSIEQT